MGHTRPSASNQIHPTRGHWVARAVAYFGFGALIGGYLLLNAVAATIDTLIWGWTGLIATGVGGLLLLAVFVLIVRRRRAR